jgi:plasmid stability protein
VSRMHERIARRLAEEAEWRERIEQALAGPERVIAPRAAAADPARLRGIPMIGGASGAIPGTVPHRQRRLDAWRGR